MNEKELILLKKKVDSAQYEAEQLKGEKKGILASLKEDFDCSTIAEAKEKRKKLKKQLEELTSTIEKKLEEIETKYLANVESD